MEEFPYYLCIFEKEWDEIAQEMGTKSRQQVEACDIYLTSGCKLFHKECGCA